MCACCLEWADYVEGKLEKYNKKTNNWVVSMQHDLFAREAYLSTSLYMNLWLRAVFFLSNHWVHLPGRERCCIFDFFDFMLYQHKAQNIMFPVHSFSFSRRRPCTVAPWEAPEGLYQFALPRFAYVFAICLYVCSWIHCTQLYCNSNSNPPSSSPTPFIPSRSAPEGREQLQL